MKRLLIAVATLFVFTATAQAQNLKWGLEVGGNLGRVTGNVNGSNGSYFQTSHTLGFQVGPYLEYQFSDLIGIQPELLFNELNTKFNSNSSSLAGNGTFELNGRTVYLNLLSLPILVRFNLTKSFSLQIGPQFDVILNNTTFYQDNPTTSGSTAINAFKTFNAGGTVAAQFDLGNWLVYGRFNLGLTNMNNCTQDSKWHKEEFQLGIGYNFSRFFKKKSNT